VFGSFVLSEGVVKRIREAVDAAAEEVGVRVWKVFLFGSRARGDYREGSDWDILVVVEERLSREKKLRFWRAIYRRVDVPVDIVIVDRETLEKYKDSYGFVYRYALSEGVAI